MSLPTNPNLGLLQGSLFTLTPRVSVPSGAGRGGANGSGGRPRAQAAPRRLSGPSGPPGGGRSFSAIFDDHGARYDWQEESVAVVSRAAPARTASEPTASTRITMRLLQTANPNDVRFYFPKTESELWANSGVLSDASPYFKTLLESEFQEGRFLTSAARSESAKGKGKRKASELDDDGEDGVDSDAETDNAHPPTRVGAESDALNPFHQIEITSASHTTYAALLGYLYTSHVSFAPLRSSNPLFPFTPSTTSLPHPASPKSLYRLSHFVGVPALSKLCLDRIRESLTVANVADELFGETPRLYPDVKEVILTFAAANWSLVRGSRGLKEVEDASGAGSDLTVLFELARRLN